MQRLPLSLIALLAATTAVAQPRTPDTDARYAALMDTADHALESGLGSEAAALYEQAASVEPQSLTAYVAAGWARLSATDAEAAGTHFATARGLADARISIDHADAIALDWGQAAVAFAQGSDVEGAVLFARHNSTASCDDHGLSGATMPALFDRVIDADSTLLAALEQSAFRATVTQVRLQPEDSEWVERLRPFDGSGAVFQTEASLHPSSLPLRLAAALGSSDPVAGVTAALALDPNNYEGRLALSSALTWASRYAEARNELVTLVGQYPDSVRAHYSLYTAQYRLGERNAAHASLARADALDPAFSAGKRGVDAVWNDQEYCRNGISQDDQTGEWIGLESALGCYEGMLIAYPENGNTWRHIGNLNYMLRNMAVAVEAFGVASGLTPESIPVWISLADAHEALGQPEDAAAALAQAVRIAPDDPSVLYAQAAASEETDRPAAIRYLRRAVAARPENFLSNYHLGRLLLLADVPGEAVLFLESARSLSPDDIDATSLIGAAYLSLGRLDKVRGEIDRLEQLDPDTAADLRQLVEEWSTEDGPDSFGMD